MVSRCHPIRCSRLITICRATMDAFKYGGNSHSMATEEYEDSDETAIVNDSDKEESTLHPVQQYDAFDPSEDMNEFNRQLWKDAQRKAQLNVTRKFISSRFKSEDPVEVSSLERHRARTHHV